MTTAISGWGDGREPDEPVGGRAAPYGQAEPGRVVRGEPYRERSERWFAALTQKKLKRGVHRSAQALEGDVRSWLVG
ncbi:hypothetical protein [Streptomyces sp. NPDC001657]|uniref:hypothetical protein n=1 Tax=Streptomyces sp. NPDC001657 TaxID=3154522 RepID=UPI003331E9A6